MTVPNQFCWFIHD